MVPIIPSIHTSVTRCTKDETACQGVLALYDQNEKLFRLGSSTILPARVHKGRSSGPERTGDLLEFLEQISG